MLATLENPLQILSFTIMINMNHFNERFSLWNYFWLFECGCDEQVRLYKYRHLHMRCGYSVRMVYINVYNCVVS